MVYEVVRTDPLAAFFPLLFPVFTGKEDGYDVVILNYKATVTARYHDLIQTHTLLHTHTHTCTHYARTHTHILYMETHTHNKN